MSTPLGDTIDDLKRQLAEVQLREELHYNRLAGILFSGRLDFVTASEVQDYVAEYIDAKRQLAIETRRANAEAALRQNYGDQLADLTKTAYATAEELREQLAEARICPQCRNTFVQPFVCTTCGAQKLYDRTLQTAVDRAETAERQLADATTRLEKLGNAHVAVCAQLERCAELERQLDEARRIQHFVKNQEYWLWLGDEEDHAESLVCPIIVQPALMNALIADRKALAEMKRERDAAIAAEEGKT